MILGEHLIDCRKDAPADRSYSQDVLGYTQLDAGQGSLIIARPPTKMAMHPHERAGEELHLPDDDLVAELSENGVSCSEVQEAPWGSISKDPASTWQRSMRVLTAGPARDRKFVNRPAT